MTLTRRFLLVVVSLLATGPSAYAEGLLGSGIRFGAEAGANFATAQFDPSLNVPGPSGTLAPQSGMTGLIVGGLVQINVGDWITIQPEVNFVQKGASFSNVGGTGDSASFKAGYLEVPVMVKANYSVGVVKVFAEAGPYLGFLLSSKMTDDKGLINQDYKSQMRGTDYGVDFGAGIAITGLPLVEPFVDVRYSLGLANVTSVSGQTSKLRGTQLRAGITF